MVIRGLVVGCPVVKQVNCADEPEVWESRNGILAIKDLGMKFKGWSFDWVSSYANGCADAAAKWARIHKCSFKCLTPLNVFYLQLFLISLWLREPLVSLICKLRCNLLLCF